jgi:hypothetical protein
MKRLFLSLLFLSVLHLAPFPVLAQLQRLAIPPQSFSLTTKGNSHNAKAYCLDRHLIISEPADFKAVLAGDTNAVSVGDRPSMTLREAIAQNLIIVKGAGVRNRRDYSEIDGTQLKFISNTDEPITIDFTQIVAMGEQNSSPVDPILLKSVRKSQSLLDFKTVQDEIWSKGIDESRLEALGFYDSVNVVRNKITTENAVKAFQIKYGLSPANGILDPDTIAALARIEQQEIQAFERLGFRRVRFDTNVRSLSDNVRALEEFLGLTSEKEPATGKFTDNLRTALNQFARDYKTHINQALFVDDPNFLQPNESALKLAPYVTTFQKGYFVTRDLYDSGKSNPLLMTGVLLETPKGIEFWQIDNKGFVKRSIGEKAFSDFDGFSRFIVSVKSSVNTLMVYSGIYKSNSKVSLQLGETKIELSPSDMEKFVAGESKHPEIDAVIEKLPADKSAKLKLMVFRSSFSQGRGAGAGKGNSLLKRFGYDQHDPLKLALAFERHYRGKVEVFVASDRELGFYNMKGIPKLEKASQIGLYVDGNFKYSTDTIEPIRKDVETAGIKVLKVGDALASETRIFIFAGHNDEAYQKLVLRLAEEGHFRNGVIILAVCGTGCEANFNSLLISKSNARAIIFYNQEINAQAVQDVLLKFAELLSCECAPDSNYQELWRKSVDKVEKTALPNLRDEVIKLRSILIQVSSVWSKSLSSNAE